MTLVYLDNSHLNLLETTRRKDPDRFARFRDRWKSEGRVLAVSRVHAAEISSSRFQEAREGRYDVIKDLFPVRTNIAVNTASRSPSTLLEVREALVALGLTPDDVQIDRHWAGFPTTAEHFELEVAVLVHESEPVRDLTGGMHLGHMVAADARAREKNARYERLRLRDLPDEPMDREEFKLGMIELKETFGRAAREHGIDPKYQESVLTGILGMYQRIQETGRRAAFAESMEADVDADASVFVDELVARAQVRRTVREHLGRAFPGNQEVLEEASALKLQDCPGTWLQHAVGQEIQSAEPRYPVGNIYDGEHIAHLPYADILLTDKRVANYVPQIRRRSPELEVWQLSNPPVSVPKDIDRLEDAVFADPPSW